MPKFLSVKTLKKLTALTLIASLLLNPIAFATSSYLEIDSQDSEAANRLHTMMPLSNVRDISHIEINPDEQRVRVYRDTETAEDNLEPETSSASARESVLEVSRDNIYNLPWQLGQEGLNSFLSQHTAWLTPLGEDDYKLDFRGRLLGGMWWGDSSEDSGGYSNDYGSGSYSSDSRQCPSNFNIDSDGCARGSDGRTIPVFNITESTVVENSNSGSSYDYGRSYGKNSDGGSSSSDTSSSDYGYTNSSSTNNQSRPATSKPAAPRPTADLSKIYARLNIKPPAKPAPKPAAPKPTVPDILARLNIKPAAKPAAKPAPKTDLSKLFAVAKPPAKPAAKPAAPVAKPTVPNILAQLNIKPAAKPVAKPAPKTDLSKLLAAAKPAAKPAPKPITNQQFYGAEIVQVGWKEKLTEKVFEKLLKTFSKETQKLVGRTNRKYKPELLEREGAPKKNTTLKAAEQELKGNQIDLAKQRGRTYDHAKKVKSAQGGLVKHIERIKDRLGYPGLPKAERQVLEKELAEASKLLDHTEGFVPRKT